MSTKIYDGLRLSDPSADLFEVVQEVSGAITAQFKIARLAEVAEAVATLVDATADDKDADRWVFDVARRRWLDEQHKLGEHHALNDPLRFSMVFARSASSGEVLALPWCLGRSEYLEALNATGLFAEYGYWDNSDRPQGVSDAEWDLRRRAWDEISNDEGTLTHLPMWQLSRSLTDVFSYDVLDQVEPGDLDVHVSPRQRLQTASEAHLFSQAVAQGREPGFALMFDCRQVARDAVVALPDDAPELPGPLPALDADLGDVARPVKPLELPVPEAC